MPGLSRTLCTYEEVDSGAFAAPERFALWRETGRLPMTVEPADAESRRRFHIRLRKVNGVSGGLPILLQPP